MSPEKSGKSANTIVFHKYAPPFATLALVLNAGDTQDASISLAIMPSLPVKHGLIVNEGWGQAQGGEMLPMLVVG